MIYYLNQTGWFPDFNTAYRSLLRTIAMKGSVVHPRPGSSLGKTKEILNACFAIPATMPLCTIAERKMSYAFAFLEPFFLFTNQDDSDVVAALTTYAPNLTKLAYNDKTKRFDGNYGDRIHLVGDIEIQNDVPENPTTAPHNQQSQLIRCFRTLKDDPNSRRAVLTIHNPVWDVINGSSKDIPCTLNLQFLIRDGKLHCFCNMRSNDIWYGTPHNVMMFTFLQRAMAGWLGVEPGDYVHRANSLHMYEQHWDKALTVADGELIEGMSPRISYPTHCDPEVTYRQAEKMIGHEAIRRKATGAGYRMDDMYEQKAVEFIDAHLSRGKAK